jgi:hypothetical protein
MPRNYKVLAARQQSYIVTSKKVPQDEVDMAHAK